MFRGVVELLLCVDLFLSVMNVLGFIAYRVTWVLLTGMRASVFYLVMTLLFVLEWVVRCILISEKYVWYRDVGTRPAAEA